MIFLNVTGRENANDVLYYLNEAAFDSFLIFDIIEVTEAFQYKYSKVCLASFDYA